MADVSIVLSGGGDKGGYQAGASRVIWEWAKRRNHRVRRGHGVSVGGINAAKLMESNDPEQLIKLWRSIDWHSVMEHWFGWWAAGYFKGGLHCTEPLRDTIKRYFDPLKLMARSSAVGVELHLGCVSLTSGKYEIIRENDPNIIEGIMATSAHPVFMEYVKAQMGERPDTQLWSDGGVRNVTPFRSAVKSESDIIISVLTTPADGPGEWDNASPNLVERTLRELEIVLDEASSDDLRWCEDRNEMVRHGTPRAKEHGWREVQLYTIRPKTPLPSSYMGLGFKPTDIEQQIEQGIADAEALFGET